MTNFWQNLDFENDHPSMKRMAELEKQCDMQPGDGIKVV